MPTPDEQPVAALYERWVKAGPPPLGTLMSRWWDARLIELREAIDRRNTPAATETADQPGPRERHHTQWAALTDTERAARLAEIDEGEPSHPIRSCPDERREMAETDTGASGVPDDTVTPSRRAGLRDDIAKAIHRYDNDHALSGNDIPSEHHRGEADAVLALLYREWAWLRAEAEDSFAANNGEQCPRTIPDNSPTSSDTTDNPAAVVWTPPPPGDRREQLPDHILALIRPYLLGYTSTACQTAAYLAQAIGDQPDHRVELGMWRERMTARCRANQKYTGEMCPHHDEEVPDA